MDLDAGGRWCFSWMLAVAIGGCTTSDDCARTAVGPTVCEPRSVGPHGVDSIGQDSWHGDVALASTVEIGDVTADLGVRERDAFYSALAKIVARARRHEPREA